MKNPVGLLKSLDCVILLNKSSIIKSVFSKGSLDVSVETALKRWKTEARKQ